MRRVLRDAAPPPAGAPLPRLGATGRCPRPSAPPRENLALPLWAGIDEATQERVVERRPRSRRRGACALISLPINRHRLWQLARRRAR